MSALEQAQQAVQGAAQTVMKKAVELAPDSWMPGGVPDPLIRHRHGHIGRSVSRIDGPFKVTGAATFAAEFAAANIAYAAGAFSTIAKGRIAQLDIAAAATSLGVVLVMTHQNALRMKPTPLFL